MTAREIIDQAREDLGDTLVPYLWSTPELIRYFNKVRTEFCKRTWCISDTTTTLITTLSAAIGARYLTISPKILFIRNARIVSTGDDISGPITEDWLDINSPSWQGQDDDFPLYFWTEPELSRMGIHPAFAAVDSVEISVFRLPLAEVTEATLDTVSMEIRDIYHLELVPGIMKWAYLKRDSNTYDPQASKDIGNTFEMSIQDAIIDLAQNRNSGAICSPHYGTI